MRRLAVAALLGVLLSLSTVTSAGAKHDFVCELFTFVHPCPQHPTQPPQPTPIPAPVPPATTAAPTPAPIPIPASTPSASPPVSVLPDAAMERP